MGFWILVPGVGMGGSGAAVAQATGRLEYTFPRSGLEFTFPLTPDVTMAGFAEETLEQP